VLKVRAAATGMSISGYLLAGASGPGCAPNDAGVAPTAKPGRPCTAARALRSWLPQRALSSLIDADASAIVKVFLAMPRAGAGRAAFAEHSAPHVPEHLAVELLTGLRRFENRGALSQVRAAAALRALRDLCMLSYPVIELAEEIWGLRAALSACDTAYLLWRAARSLGS